MTRTEYERTTSAKLKGRRALTLVEMRNGETRVPANTVVTICGKSGKRLNGGGPGLAIEMEACKACGVSVYMTRVGIADLELLPE